VSDQGAAVLDASALLAYLRDEPGAARVQAAIAGGVLVSAVNWAETLSKLADYGQAPDATAEALQAGGVYQQLVEVVPFDEPLARETARLRRVTRARGLSLGDRACLALGRLRSLPVLTADRAWSALPLKMRIVQIR
jgi:PIN domain nuclease of toxin-antitoxin system